MQPKLGKMLLEGELVASQACSACPLAVLLEVVFWLSERHADMEYHEAVSGIQGRAKANARFPGLLKQTRCVSFWYSGILQAPAWEPPLMTLKHGTGRVSF